MVERDVVTGKMNVTPHLEETGVERQGCRHCCRVDAFIVRGDVVLDVTVRVRDVEDKVGALLNVRGFSLDVGHLIPKMIPFGIVSMIAFCDERAPASKEIRTPHHTIRYQRRNVGRSWFGST